MNFLTIRYFLALNRERNFTRAAESLYITQQTLSAHIAALEKELGSLLFERTTPLKLTYAGHSFLKYAVHFDRLNSSLKDEFDDLRNNRRGLLRVGIATTRAKILIPNIMLLFHKEYPDIELQLVEAINDDLPKPCWREMST
jgi:DNA-binding transcriptional LysR family regulator